MLTTPKNEVRMRRKAHRPLILGTASFIRYYGNTPRAKAIRIQLQRNKAKSIRKELIKKGESFAGHVPDIISSVYDGKAEPNKEVNHR